MLLGSCRLAGSGAATGVGGADKSAVTGTSPPNSSKSSACFVFFDPSFIPLPLNAGARSEDGAGEGFLGTLISAVSKREIEV
jgi:hypothetical protein